MHWPNSADGPLRSSLARRLSAHSRPSRDGGSSNERLLGSIAADGSRKISRRQSPVLKPGCCLPVFGCSPGALREPEPWALLMSPTLRITRDTALDLPIAFGNERIVAACSDDTQPVCRGMAILRRPVQHKGDFKSVTACERTGYPPLHDHLDRIAACVELRIRRIERRSDELRPAAGHENRHRSKQGNAQDAECDRPLGKSHGALLQSWIEVR